ncbi:MAG TPA: bifunctional tetrahydrofolate synthase/dihydrofolate synthase [Steroidobacteraceae bacterium]|jgi:dihydrofolate synthase/folylpolyglutamate synthase
MTGPSERSPRFRRLADWLAWQEQLHPNAIDLGLERLQRTLDRLSWQRPAGPVITIAGTNGKGSCVALTARILAEAGYRVGTFTSPHLLRYNERIAVGGVEVSDAALMKAFERIDAARGDDTLTFFEFNAAAALLVFADAQPDAVVMEVGMGGRLDAVNVVDADVAVVTSIDLDHCDWLGRDRESIGREKAGIFRGGRPAIFGARAMPASIAEHAQRIGADLQQLGRDFDWVKAGQRWSWRGRTGEQRDLPAPALHGEIQYDNAAAVLAALEALQSPLPVPRSAIERGLQTVTLPGRFQVIRASSERPVEWILDVAHNPAAAHTLAAQLAARSTNGRTIAVCGVLADKDVEGIVTELRDSFDAWIIVGLQGGRALPPETLAERVRAVGVDVEAVADDVVAGCQAAEALARPGDRVVVFGSFLTVGPALYTLQPWIA